MPLIYVFFLDLVDLHTTFVDTTFFPNALSTVVKLTLFMLSILDLFEYNISSKCPGCPKQPERNEYCSQVFDLAVQTQRQSVHSNPAMLSDDQFGMDSIEHAVCDFCA